MKVLGPQTMLRVALVLVIFALSLCYGSLIPDQPADGGKDMTSGGDQGNMNSEDTKSIVDLMGIMHQCNETFRINIGYIEALDASGSFPDETDRTPKCYIRCVLENTGVASEDGKYDPARAAQVFAGERGGKTMTDIQDLAASCADRKETCKCERSYMFMKCLMEAEIKEYESN